MHKGFEIREILPKDNTVIEQVIREVFDELNIPKVGTAYEDPELLNLYQAYQKPRAIYYLVLHENVVLGGAGIAQLANNDQDICELQKMYFHPTARGKGLGAELINKCMQKAKELSFKGCYLETMPYMKAAQRLYQQTGFNYIDGPMGCTGHSACPVFMYKTL